MLILRLVLLLVVVVGLAALTLQNLTPQLSLVFLGVRSLPLPLGYLVLAAIVAGLSTGLLLLALLRLHRYLIWREFERSEPMDSTPPETPPAWNQPRSAPPPPRSTSPPPGREYEGVDQSNYLRDDWSYETAQTPRSTSQAGSSYSYSYRDSRKSEPEESTGTPRKSVYDADYRVINPPQKPQEEDYGFEDEE
uniref:Lipopolysaccharide assembly protein A domain-containing protein n=1 Tax=Cyanothece sp. (strain PCC 7425 / ATCC 29141) TaxID=395961 RepID=B8HRI0_CYAP4